VIREYDEGLQWDICTIGGYVRRGAKMGDLIEDMMEEREYHEEDVHNVELW
jgi:hypothetical protein